MPPSASSSPQWTAKMAPSTLTATSSSSNSTITTTTSTLHVPFQLLEITLISAQDLAHVSKSMRTYAVAWVDPDRKFTTRAGQQGHANPTWNDKFVLKVDDQFLTSDTSAVMVEIYTTSWLRHTLVGSVRVLINNLIPPSTRSATNTSARFVGLQIRRPSGTPQGILYMGVSILDTSTLASSTIGFCDIKKNKDIGSGGESDKSEEKRIKEGDEEKKKTEEQMSEKVQLYRSRSVGSEEEFSVKPSLTYNDSNVNGSVCNGSIVNESELSSDVGPSASIVAAEIAKKESNPQKKTTTAAATDDDTGSSIVEDLTVEEAAAKGYKTKNESRKTDSKSNSGTATATTTDDHDLIVAKSNRGHPRRHSDGGGLFSCFGNAYGFEFTIVCGAPYSNNNKKKKVGNNKNALSPNDLNLRRSHRSA